MALSVFSQSSSEFQQERVPVGANQSLVCNLKEKMFALCASQIVIFLVRFADFARTCAVIVNVPDLKAYSSYAARNSDRVELRY